MTAIEILPLHFVGGDLSNVEVVERKGVGHPDTLCDAIAERASRLYSHYCMENFERIAHHWFDKVLLLGGESKIEFGRGELLRPFEVVYAGKAAFTVGSHQIPMDDILQKAASSVLEDVLHGFDSSKHLRVSNKLSDYRGPGRQSSRYRPRSSAELMSLDEQNRVSNDCNVLAGYAPLSRLEHLVLDFEYLLAGPDSKLEYPDTGFDVKVMATRFGRTCNVLVNLPFIADAVSSADMYQRRIREMHAVLLDRAIVEHDLEIVLSLNPADATGSPYLTVTGTVADTGDVGVVGRGNRVNGLIAPLRPMSIEAASGKNPLDHTGKIYSVLVDRLATLIANAGGNTVVVIATSKGRPIDDPDCVVVQTDLRRSPQVDSDLLVMVRESLAGVHSISREIVYGGRSFW